MADPSPPFTYNFIRLTTKPSAQLGYYFQPSTALPGSPPSLIVFVNGLGRPQTTWVSAVTQLSRIRSGRLPAILTYDRFGQGQSVDRDPDDAGAPDPTHAHDCKSAVRDMRQLVCQIINQLIGIKDPDDVKLVLVGNSIGCALIRLYAEEYPQHVAGILLLDSTLTNSDFVSMIPDPEGPNFVPQPDITTEQFLSARKTLRMIFHPDVGNNEGLSRRNLNQLLPDADLPKLGGLDGQGAYLTVIGHDFDTFAKDTEEKIKIPQLISQRYVNPVWEKYNEGLASLTARDRSEGPVQAPGASHFVQEDNPGFVAEKLSDVIAKSLG